MVIALASSTSSSGVSAARRLLNGTPDLLNSLSCSSTKLLNMVLVTALVPNWS